MTYINKAPKGITEEVEAMFLDFCGQDGGESIG